MPAFAKAGLIPLNAECNLTIEKRLMWGFQRGGIAGGVDSVRQAPPLLGIDLWPNRG